jgi:hypothetical protein
MSYIRQRKCTHKYTNTTEFICTHINAHIQKYIIVYIFIIFEPLNRQRNKTKINTYGHVYNVFFIQTYTPHWISHIIYNIIKV